MQRTQRDDTQCHANDTYLDGIKTTRDAAILNLNMWWWMCEFAFGVSARALVACELTTHLQRQPSRVLYIWIEYSLCGQNRVDHRHRR